MTDKEYREQKARIKKLLNKWVSPLGLDWWQLKYFYIRGEHDPNEETNYAPFSGKSSKYVCIMDVSTDYYYKTANIRFFLQTVMDYPDDEVERYLVHELMHIHLKPMQSKQKYEEEELVATQLADAFIWVRQAGQKDK